MNTEHRPPHWSQFLGLNFRKIGLLILLGAALAFGGWKGLEYLRAQKRVRLASVTREFLKQGDLRSAALTARQILKEEPGNLAALRVMAEVADRTGSPAAVLWRGRLAELEPGRVENSLDWAASALRSGQVPSAKLALSKVPAAGAHTARFFELAGATALAAGQFAEAEKQFAEAVRLDPTNASQRVNLEVLRLQSPDAATAADARKNLARLGEDGTQRLRVLRTLIADARRRKDYAEGLRLSRSMVQDPQAAFSDHLHQVMLLREVKGKDFDGELARLQERAAATTQDVSQLAGWMNQIGWAKEALAWIQSLPAKIRDTIPVPIAAAECHIRLASWNELNLGLQKQNWAELDFLRFAFMARALRELDRSAASRNAWNQAVSAAGQDPQKQAMLARLADGWRWLAETEQLWWMIALGNANQRLALAALNRLYTERKNERMLLRVAARAYNLAPSDLIAKNNYALLSALLKDRPEQAYLLAKENFNRHPDNPVFRSTYAFTLHQQGKTKEALEVFSAIPPEKLKRPSLAAYYGILLAANGLKEEALPRLKTAQTNDTLLPSEKRLVEQALALVK